MKLFRRVSILIAALIAVGLPASAIAHNGGKLVVFDEGHGQRFLISGNGSLDLGTFSRLFQDEGITVQSNKGRITNEALAGADALVISGAFVPFSEAEVETVIRFVQRGGRLCIMLHIGRPVEQLLRKMGVLVSLSPVREEENRLDGAVLNYQIVDFSPHELTQGLHGFNVYGGWALMNKNENVQIIAQTSAKAWIDLNGNNSRDENEVQWHLGLVVAGRSGKGQFAVFGDDAIFQNQFLKDGNLALGRNLVRWLGAAKRQ